MQTRTPPIELKAPATPLDEAPATPLDEVDRRAHCEVEVPTPPSGMRVPLPPTEPASETFKRRKYRSSPTSSRNGSPPDSLTSSTINAADSQPPVERSKLPRLRLYLGKDVEALDKSTYGQFGPGMYNVRCSKTGSPLRGSKGTPRLGVGPRFSRDECYEGKENMHLLLGQFGPGLYDIRCFNTGSPKGGGKGTPRFGSGARFDREKCYDGKEHVKFGREGPTASYDAPRCSNRGSPLWKVRPSAAFALPHVRGALRTTPA